MKLWADWSTTSILAYRARLFMEPNLKKITSASGFTPFAWFFLQKALYKKMLDAVEMVEEQAMCSGYTNLSI